ncbi:uncharacterized protein LOC141617129 [Silene latifolia]|uniref:uncharacterized protein LOC141617129 n=1 Tax=Silene latifolia TaxID=37657 RepID=UPI003D77DE61
MSLICRVSAMAATTMLINSISKRAFPSILLSHQNFLFPSHFSSLSSSSSSPSPSSDISHLAQATKNTVDILLKGVNDRSLVEEIKHILEMANRASLRREILHTNFLTPPTLNEAMAVLNKLVDVSAMSNGGYPEAERCRLSVGHVEILTTLPDTVAALSITGNFGFQPPTHGDFLGSILGTGIAREKLGDIILQGDKGAQVLIVPELVDYIISSLTKVGNVPVSCTMVPLEALEYEPPRLKTLRTVESSLRVDAIASAGFKISRSKFSELISKGDVRINWSTVTKNGATLKTGDLVSVSGQGRLKIGEINTTKRGKYAVELMRYL